ncbi:MAG TPA: hypothetical protein VHU22_00530 [Xanthobacteraceae bacterium]|jgi:hypothetical protein|nr:hypothetical protein [Xanthobacteraceae bacterium]
MAVKKSRIIAACLAASLSGVSLWGSPWAATQAQARGPYDGTWSVLIVTDSGTCDRGYRYALRISDGRVYYDDPSFNVTGHVDAHGNVSVGVRAGDQYANGTGHLSGDYGDGHWSGRSPSSACSGHWEAERRG